MKFTSIRVAFTLLVGMTVSTSALAQLPFQNNLLVPGQSPFPIPAGRNQLENAAGGSPRALPLPGALERLIAGYRNGANSNGIGGQPTFSTTTGNNGETALAVYKGTLTLNFPGGKSLEIKEGQATILNNDDPSSSEVRPLGSLMQNPVYKEMLMRVVKQSATVLAANTDSGKSADLTRALAAIVQTVSAADPNAAREIVEVATDELTKDGQSSDETLKAISTVVAAAANGSNQDRTSLTEYAVGAANKNGSTDVTATILNNTSITSALREVFDSTTVVVPIDITLVSPSG